MFSNLKIGTKILIVFVSIGVVAVAVIGVFAYSLGGATLERESFNKLTAVREMKADQIEDYFQEIRDQVVTLSEDRMIIDAMKAFDSAFHLAEHELGITDAEMGAMDSQLRGYYEDEFLARLIPNLLRDVTVSEYWPQDRSTRVLQSLYISSNPHDVGSKNLLDNPGDGSSYSEAHEIYHPILANYLERFGYYDIFLVDADTSGHISYSVFKEIDFGTSLLYGPYSDANFAAAYQAAREATNKDFVKLVDFEPYQPSYNAPAAFIASPIFDGPDKVGVLVFQMPVDRINGIMTSGEGWADVGLGESGETYIVGDDYTLRNQSRFLIEDPENYFQAIEEVGVPLDTRARIRNINSTIGLQEVRTRGTEAALQGESGSAIFPDYRGVPVLSAYGPLNIEDVRWAIMSEIDESEAFATIGVLATRTSIAAIVLIAAIVVTAVFFARSLTRPLVELTGKADELASGNLDVAIRSSDQKDEIGKLARSFDVMRASLKQMVEELQDINQHLEERVAERTVELERATERVRSIVQNASDAIITIDSDQNIVLFNPQAEETLGYTEAEVLGKPLTLLMVEESRAVHPKEVDKFRNEPAKSRGMDVRRSIRGQRKDGTVFPAEAGISKMVLDGEVFFTAFLRDVTERVEAQEQLTLQAAALHSAANGIAITDTEGIIQWVNPAFTGLTGYSSEDAVGQTPRVLKSDKHEEAFYTGMWDRIKSGQVWQGEVINRRKDGSQYTEEMTITPVTDVDGEIIHFVAIKQDITERKRMALQLEEAFETIKIQKERMEVELNFAREIQMNMLPLIFPAFPAREEIDLYAALEPAREVGGDFYDFYFLDEDHLCFVIGDVSGKGAPGALLMAVSKTLIKSRALDDSEPASILTHVNDELSRDNESAMFVTIFLGILNVKTGDLEFTNAGHNPPYIKREDGTVEIVDAFHGPVIGAMPGLPYKQDSAVLGHNDTIVLYTDGVTEAMDESERLFTDRRFADLLSSDDVVTPQSVIERTLSEVKRHQGDAIQADDITMLAVQYTGHWQETEGQRLSLSIKNRAEELAFVEEAFHEYGAKNHIPDTVRQQLSIVLDELLNNIVSYAYEDDAEHDIEVDVELSGRRLALVIRDDGVPFNPFGLESPDVSKPMEERQIGGLGIHLVRSLMDEYLYQRQINKNVVTLVKMISG